MDTRRLRSYRLGNVLLALLLILALSACSGNSSGTLEFGNAPEVRTTQPLKAKITAQWLRAQPGRQLGDFSFHLLEADNRPLADWQGLAIEATADGGEAGARASFTLTARQPAPDDIYLYAVYDGRRFAFDSAQAQDAASGEYVLLAVPRRIEGVVAIGLARIGMRRGASNVAGELARISFSAGPEQARRTISAVNEDPRSSAVFSASGGGDYLVADISWEERNIGDYNNNGLVEVADLTPVGIYFNQEVATADDPELLAIVDGNLDGFVTVHDITPIGQNFGARIDGFRLYAAFMPDPAPQDFELYPLAEYASYPRSAVYDAADALAKKKRLRYSVAELPVENPGGSWEGGKVSFQVRAYADDGGSITEGPPSNSIELTFGGLPGPPDWLDPINAAGITDAWGDMEDGAAGVWVEFGGAYDVEGDDIYYRIYYAEEGELIFGPLGAMLEVPEADLSAGPPYRYFISKIERNDVVEDLLRGTDYQFYVAVTDDSGWGETPGKDYLFARPPGLGTSPEPWSHYRGDAQRTGCNPDCTLVDPVEWNELAALPGGSPPEFTQTVISDAGWALASSADSTPQQVDLSDGSESPRGSLNTDGQFFTALSGERIIVSNGAQLQSMNYDGSDLRTTDINCGVAPLVLGDLLYVVSEGGDITCLTADRLIEQWRHDLDLAQPPDAVLAPVADNQFVYYAVDQMLFKYYLISGHAANSATLPYPPVGGSLAIDVERGNLYCCVADTSELPDALVQFHTSNMLQVGSFFCPADFLPTAAPCLALNQDLPVAIVAIGRSGNDTSNLLIKYGLNSGTGWQLSSGDQRVNEITCSAERIFLTTDSGYIVFDFSGRLIQDYELGAIDTELALDGARGLLANTGLDILTTAVPDPPPYNLDGVAGIQSLSVGDGEFTASWNSNYIDEHGERFGYAIFYSSEWPVEFDAPRAHTQVVFAAAGEGSRTVQGVDNGTRYWVGVRAYDGYWGVDENMELNTRMLAATPPWQREELKLGADLPDGRIYFMRGLVDPLGEIHLVYNDVDDTHLTHAWGDTGAWSYEDVLYNTDVPASAQGFEPAWDSGNGRLAIAYASMPQSTIGLLADQGAEYTNQTFGDTTPALNPQVSLAIGTESALAYTQDIFDVTVESHVDYYLKRTIGGVWQGYEPMEETNLSGRDLDIVLDPGDNTTPWAAVQRGGESTPNRHTPQEGECLYARWNSGGGTWDYELVDAGDNAPDSDCGKRVQQVLDSDGHPHLAYLDLNSSPDSPRGQLKYASYDGGSWLVEIVAGFDLGFQTTGGLQFTWGELGLALADDGAGGQRPVIAMLSRRSGSEVGEPHQAIAEVWVRDDVDSWRLERLTDAEWAFPRDREPGILLITPDGVWHVFYATTSDQDVWDDADLLVHLWRPVTD